MLQTHKHSVIMSWLSIILKVHISCQLLLSTIVVVLNGPFLITLVRNGSLHTPSNSILGCLCFSDLSIGMVTFFLWSCNIPALMDISMDNGNTLFLIIKIYDVFTGFSAIFIAAVNLDRYFAICHPFKYLQYATAKLYAIASVCACLLYTGLVSSSILIDNIYNTLSVYMVVMITVTIAIMIVTYCSWRIFKVIHRHSREIASVGQLHGRQNSGYHHDSKRYQLIVALVIIFAVCNLPRIVSVFVVIVCGIREFSQGLSIYASVSDTLVLLNSCINPIVYVVRIRLFRNAVKEIICCCQRTVWQSLYMECRTFLGLDQTLFPESAFRDWACNMKLPSFQRFNVSI